MNQSSNPKWDRMNHEWTGGIQDGYALCSNCMCMENSSEAASYCTKGPVAIKIKKDIIDIIDYVSE